MKCRVSVLRPLLVALFEARPNRYLRLRARTMLVIVLGLSCVAAFVRGQSIDENQFKAAFLYNIAKFVEWPSGTFKSSRDPIVCCVLGKGPFSSVLEDTANQQVIEQRPFIMRHVYDAGQSEGCHLLFVSASEQKRWVSVSRAIRGRSILTVGEDVEFASNGGIITFKFSESGKANIQINLDRAEQNRLKISSKLLNLSQIVTMK
jgi:hypothetical protein